MNRRGLRLAVAAILAGIGVLMAIFGAVYNLVFFGLAVPFCAGAYLIWLDATGRLHRRGRSRGPGYRRRTRATAGGGRRRRGPQRRGRGPPDAPDRIERAEARAVLGVDAGADDATIRRAYRERVKDAHPDAADGSEEAFKRVTDAYERLRGERA